LREQGILQGGGTNKMHFAVHPKNTICYLQDQKQSKLEIKELARSD
jgi:hypothetical protein